MALETSVLNASQICDVVHFKSWRVYEKNGVFLFSACEERGCSVQVTLTKPGGNSPYDVGTGQRMQDALFRTDDASYV